MTDFLKNHFNQFYQEINFVIINVTIFFLFLRFVVLLNISDVPG